MYKEDRDIKFDHEILIPEDDADLLLIEQSKLI